MTLLFIDSFDHYTTTAQTLEKWTNTGVYFTAAGVGAYGRYGTNGFRVTGNGANDSAYLAYQLPSQPQTLIAGNARRFSSIMAKTAQGYNNGIGFTDAGVFQVSMVVDTDGSIYVVRGSWLAGTLLGTSATGIVKKNSWSYIEFKATIHNTTGSYEVKVNGVSVLSDTNVDTQDTANAYADKVYIGLKSGNDQSTGTWLDDLYICDDQGSESNDFLGDIRVQCLFPSGAGNYSQWTPLSGNNYENVDEATPDDDTTYVHTTVSGNKDSYTFENLTTISGEVFGAFIHSWGRKANAGTKFMRNFIRTNSTDYEQNLISLSDSYGYFSNLIVQNPDTTSGWAIVDINSLEVGIKGES